MFDIGLSKMALIGAVALVVIGPEKLPRVARTVGTLLGKAQRYVSDVKAEVNRSMELDELRKMKDTVEGAARDVEQSIHTSAANFEKDWNESTASLKRHVFLVRLLFLRLRQRYVQCRGAGLPPPGQELAPQACRRAPVVQGPRRRAHQGAVGRGARGALSPPEVPLKMPARRGPRGNQPSLCHPGTRHCRILPDPSGFLLFTPGPWMPLRPAAVSHHVRHST